MPSGCSMTRTHIGSHSVKRESQMKSRRAPRPLLRASRYRRLTATVPVEIKWRRRGRPLVDSVMDSGAYMDYYAGKLIDSNGFAEFFAWQLYYKGHANLMCRNCTQPPGVSQIPRSFRDNAFSTTG